MTKTFIIPILSTPERLDQALAKLMPEYSRTQIKDWIDNGQVLLNSSVVKAKTKVAGGETVSVQVTNKVQPTWEAQAIQLNIVHEDDDLLIINKPVGLVVHPGAGNPNQTLLNALLYHCPTLKDLPRAGILHRLDKDTSGLLIIAKTAAALKDLSMQLKNRTITREYQAIVYGTMISGSTIDAPIGRHALKRTLMAVTESGKPAITHYRVAEKFRAHTRLKVKLETGRTHQIRVHMAYIKHPIVGDSVYGGRVKLAKGMSPELIDEIRGFRRQALHAYAIELMHPTINKELRIEIDLPDDMNRLLKLLREDTKDHLE